jgi:hypothetical protein
MPARGGAQDSFGASSRANATVLSKPCGPVMSTWTPPRKGSAAIPGFIRLGEALSGGGLDALLTGGAEDQEYFRRQIMENETYLKSVGFMDKGKRPYRLNQ